VLFKVFNDAIPPQSDQEAITITVDGNHPPVLALIGSRMVMEDETLEIFLGASDPDGDALSFSVDNLPADASFVDAGNGSAQMSWTPGAADNYQLTVSVADDGDPPCSVEETVNISMMRRSIGRVWRSSAIPA
jgi:hypothetical protein